MTTFKVTIDYESSHKGTPLGNFTEDFWVNAKDVQYAKYYYHKYTHENYDNVERVWEDEHAHPVSADIEHSLREITEVDYIDGLSHLKKL